VSALFFSSKVISFLRYSEAWWSGTQFYWMKQEYIEHIMGKMAMRGDEGLLFVTEKCQLLVLKKKVP
jgi:hypothetical protein